MKFKLQNVWQYIQWRIQGAPLKFDRLRGFSRSPILYVKRRLRQIAQKSLEFPQSLQGP